MAQLASTEMALTKDDIRLAAERLHQAEQTRRQIRQLSLDHPGITIEDAYAIQKAWIEIKVAEAAWSKATRSASHRRPCRARLVSMSRIPASCSTTCSLPMVASCHPTASSERGSKP